MALLMTDLTCAEVASALKDVNPLVPSVCNCPLLTETLLNAGGFPNVPNTVFPLSRS